MDILLDMDHTHNPGPVIQLKIWLDMIMIDPILQTLLYMLYINLFPYIKMVIVYPPVDCNLTASKQWQSQNIKNMLSRGALKSMSWPLS